MARAFLTLVARACIALCCVVLCCVVLCVCVCVCVQTPEERRVLRRQATSKRLTSVRIVAFLLDRIQSVIKSGQQHL